MPPKLALIICSCFVLWLLRLDVLRTRGVATALWIPALWMTYCASRPLAVWLGLSDLNADDSNVEAGSPVDRAFSSLLLVAGVVILAKRRVNLSQVVGENRWLLLLFGYMLVSVLWSDFPFVAFKRWVRACGSIVMALVVLTDPMPRQALESVLRRSIYVLIPFSALLVKYFSELGHDYDVWSGETMWIGVTPQKNALGRLCLISGFFLFWDTYCQWRKKESPAVKYQLLADTSVFVLTIWLLLGSHSVTSLLVMITGVGAFLVMSRTQQYLKRAKAVIEMAVLFGAVGVTAVYFFFGDALFAAAAGSFGRDLTFTGRTEIWGVLKPFAAQHPFLGVGYGSFWIHPQTRWRGLNEGHNGYLDVVLDLGFVGLSLLVSFLIAFYWRARAALTRNFDWAGFNICFLLMAVIHNFTESSFARSTTQLWVVMIFLAVLAPFVYAESGEAETSAEDVAPEFKAASVVEVAPVGMPAEAPSGGAP